MRAVFNTPPSREHEVYCSCAAISGPQRAPNAWKWVNPSIITNIGRAPEPKTANFTHFTSTFQKKIDIFFEKTARAERGRLTPLYPPPETYQTTSVTLLADIFRNVLRALESQ